MAGCGADTDANALIGSLTGDAAFPIPNVDLSGLTFPEEALNQEVKALQVADLTTGAVDGPGVFDVLMRGFQAHLNKEFEAGRITGNDYTKAYIALTESAMSQGIAFMLGKDNAFWQAQLAQIQAFTARVQLEETKIRVAATQYDAANQKASYALTKLRMSNESAAYCTAQYNLTNLLPAQLKVVQAEETGKKISNDTSSYSLANLLPAQLKVTQAEEAGKKISNDSASYSLANILPKQADMLDAQRAQQVIETTTAQYNLDQMLPEQLALLTVQKQGQTVANDTATYNLASTLPQQLQNLIAQGKMLYEQTEAQRAQTKNNRSDGEAVEGVLGKQKELYAQQITSYQRDSEMKVAKLFSDSWITQKTIDEGLTPPNSFTNAEIEKVLVQVRQKANLGV